MCSDSDCAPGYCTIIRECLYFSLARAILCPACSWYAILQCSPARRLMFLSGAAEDMAHSSLRFGIGRFTTEAEVDFVVAHIIKTVHKLREMRYGSLSSVSWCMLNTVAALCGRWCRKGLILIRLIGRNISLHVTLLSFYIHNLCASVRNTV